MYENVLCIILHSFEAQNQRPAFDFIKNVFDTSGSKHDKIFEIAKSRTSSEFDFLTDSKKQKTLKSFESDSYGPALPKSEFKAHQSLIKFLALYEVEKVPSSSWPGKFGSHSSDILKTHAKFCHLDDVQAALARWAAFVSINQTHSLDYQLFMEILEKLIVSHAVTSVTRKKKGQNATCNLLPSMKPVKSMVPVFFAGKKKLEAQKSTSEERVYKLKTDDAKMTEKFWSATKKLKDPILTFVTRLNDEEDTDGRKMEDLKKIFSVIDKIGKLENLKLNSDFQTSMSTAISDSATMFLAKTIDQNSLNGCSDSERLTELIRILVATIDNFNTFSNRFSALFDT